MPLLAILTKAEQIAFNKPPLFTLAEREEFFNPDETLTLILSKLSGSINKMGFLLLFDYFKATGRFFDIDNFAEAEIEYVRQLLTYQTLTSLSSTTMLALKESIELVSHGIFIMRFLVKSKKKYWRHKLNSTLKNVSVLRKSYFRLPNNTAMKKRYWGPSI